MKKTIFTSLSCAITLVITMTCLQTSFAQSYDIVAVNTHTGWVKRISKISDANEFNPCWSPNGKKVAHDVIGGPASGYNQSIFITDVHSGESYPLAGGEGGNDPDWSPDGKTIAFDLYFYCIVTVPETGGAPNYIRCDAVSADWSPNSKRLVFHQQSDGSIRTIDVLTLEETFVAYGEHPVWSPNGQYIAYGFNGGIWKIRVNTNGVPQGDPVQITTSGGMPTWSQNSKFIAFHDWPAGEPDIWMVSANGGTPTKLSGRPGGFETGDYDPSWSNNGQYVAYASFWDYVEPVPPSNECEVRLEQNFPNPFRTSTTVGFTLSSKQFVRVVVYDMLGHSIHKLAEGEFEAGYHELQWKGDDTSGSQVPGGVYLCKLYTNTNLQAIKLNRVE